MNKSCVGYTQMNESCVNCTGDSPSPSRTPNPGKKGPGLTTVNGEGVYRMIRGDALGSHL
eukprot:2731459-Pyramimonas_sp.AAC.1